MDINSLYLEETFMIILVIYLQNQLLAIIFFQSIKNIISQNNIDFFLDYSKFIFARPSSQILISIIHSYSPLNIFTLDTHLNYYV